MLRDLRELRRHGLLRTLRDLVTGRPLSVLVHEHRELRYTAPPHPRRRVLAVVTIALAAVVGTLGVTRRQRTLPADVTFAGALDLLRGAGGTAPAFRGALDIEWEAGLARSDNARSAWLALLTPALPPPYCQGVDSALAGDIRALDRAVATRRATTIARPAAQFAERHGTRGGDRAARLARYNLARAHLVTGDSVQASRDLRPLIQRVLDAPPLRPVAIEDPEFEFATGWLAGMAALKTQQWADAVRLFRHAIRSSRVGTGHSEWGDEDDAGDPSGAGRPVQTVAADCAASPRGAALEAYAGLIAAYLAYPGYRHDDPDALRYELRRDAATLETYDLLAPLIRYGQRVAPALQQSARNTAIPENFLWAASNLQRVHHRYRASMDSRLDVARAVVLLQLADSTPWRQAIGDSTKTACDRLARLGADLARAELRPDRPPPLTADSARAALALSVMASVQKCPPESRLAMSDTVRAAWVAMGGGRMRDAALVGLERSRRHLAGMRAGDSVDAATAERLAGGGRGSDGALVAQWRHAVFREMSDSLRAALARGGGAVRPAEPARAAALLRSIAYLAGDEPETTFGGLNIPGRFQLAPLAAFGYRFYARAAHWWVLAGVFGAAFVALLVVIPVRCVRAWRIDLLTRGRFYATEAAELDG